MTIGDYSPEYAVDCARINWYDTPVSERPEWNWSYCQMVIEGNVGSYDEITPEFWAACREYFGS